MSGERSASGRPDPGAPARARLILADLLAFDRSRLAYGLAVRTMIGLMVPLLLARALERPELVFVGLGAFLVAIGDCLDDGDRHQPLRIAVGALLGALAVATGVLAGGHLALAVLGMLVWGLITGMMGVYGPAFTTMALPVAWAYVEIGVPSPVHSLSHALQLGALFALGGGVTLVLTLALRFGGPHAPLRAQTAACYRELAAYCEEDTPPGTVLVNAVSTETQVRRAVAEARRRALAARSASRDPADPAPGRPQGMRRRQMVLIDLADHLFSVIAAMKEEGHPLPALVPQALRTLAQAVDHPREATARVRPLLARLEAPPGVPADASGPAVTLDPRLRQDLARGLRAVLEAQDPAAARLAPAERAESAPDDPMGRTPSPRRMRDRLGGAGPRLTRALAPLVHNLNWNAVVARHALRFAVVTSVAVMVLWVFPGPFGYWVPLTVTVVLKPYAGQTLNRTIQRIAGTAGGILLGTALMPLLPTAALQLGAVGLAFSGLMLVLPFNYSLAIFFLSAGLIPFEHFLDPGLDLNLAAMRLTATGIGAALALVGGHLLWPSFERHALPALVAASLRSMARYLDVVLRRLEGEAPAGAAQAARRQAGRDTTNLQATLQRTLTEVGGQPAQTLAALRAATALQHLLITLNALLHATPVPLAPCGALPQPAAFRSALVAALAGLAEDGQGPSPDALRTGMPAGEGAAGAFLDREIDSLLADYARLRAAVAEMASAVGAEGG